MKFLINMSDSRNTEKKVIAKLVKRGDTGLKKYGNTMDRKDLTATQWAEHAQEELLDGSQYLERIIEGLKLLESAYDILNEVSGVTLKRRLVINNWITKYNEQFPQHKKCSVCSGNGKLAIEQGFENGTYITEMAVCACCNGTGKVIA